MGISVIVSLRVLSSKLLNRIFMKSETGSGDVIFKPKLSRHGTDVVSLTSSVT
jgi:hypothetical protein